MRIRTIAMLACIVVLLMACGKDKDSDKINTVDKTLSSAESDKVSSEKEKETNTEENIENVRFIEENYPLYYDATNGYTIFENKKTLKEELSVPVLINYVPTEIDEKTGTAKCIEKHNIKLGKY